MARILALIVGLPLSILIVALAVANRRPVTLSLDPFSPDSPAFSVTVPLFAIIFGGVIFGLVLGGLYTWMRQGRYRREARRTRRDLARVQAAQPDPLPMGSTLPATVRR